MRIWATVAAVVGAALVIAVQGGPFVGPTLLAITDAHGVHVADVAAVLVSVQIAVLIWRQPQSA